jgi:phosphoheptose isomerase
MIEKFPYQKYNSIKLFYKDYINILNKCLHKIDEESLSKIAKEIFVALKKKKHIFICGNGGSAAIANHFLADYAKYIKTNKKLKPHVTSLSANVEIITAISNDIKFDNIFSYQLENLINKNDLLIAISSSGNSKNILEAIKMCNNKGGKSISFLGFNGGEAKKISNYSLVLNVRNYGLSEDSAHIFMHVICQYLKQKLSNLRINKIIF